MNPREYRYTDKHEWIHVDSGNTARIGITNYAQLKLGEIVFLDFAAPGTDLEQNQRIGEIESRKAVSELTTPASGQIIEANQSAIDNPGLVNRDPYAAGWLIKLHLTKPTELDVLMSGDEYDKFEAKLLQG